MYPPPHASTAMARVNAAAAARKMFLAFLLSWAFAGLLNRELSAMVLYISKVS